jgi:hypothetical protein
MQQALLRYYGNALKDLTCHNMEYFFKQILDPPRKPVFLYMNEPMTSVLYAVQPPGATASVCAYTN